LGTAAAVADQSDVIAFLSDHENYEGQPEDVERLETHGAFVFLAGNLAIKLKRAVKLPYMDFSTIEKRAEACRNEIRRNQPTAPDIYRDALPVVRTTDGGIAFGGAGDVIDWVVRMRRFDQADLFDQRAQQGQLSPDLMVPLADHISNYHARAQQHPDLDGDDILAHVVTSTIKSFLYAADVFGLSEVRRYSGQAVASLNANSRLLRKRSHQGYVRLCHGDLHLRNIVLHDGRPTLFDAIEFDDRLATVDVLYDVAFLLMDLWRRDLKTHANLCFNHYVSKALNADALDGLAAMPLFLSARAAVRAMVAIDQLSITDRDGGEDKIREARQYFQLANSFLETSRPRLIAIGGYSGTGKSTVAAGLARNLGAAPGALHLRSDVERKHMFGVDLSENLPKHAYSEAVTENVYRRLCNRAERVLKAGHTVIVDAVFLNAHQRRWIELVGARANVPFTGLWLEAEESKLLERVNQRQNDASDADQAVVLRQLRTRTVVSCWTSVDVNCERQTAIERACAVTLDYHQEPAG